MRFGTCGGELKKATTDLPFKLDTNRIVIMKELPVLQCANCPEYLIEDDILRWIEKVLSRVEKGTELEIVRYAA